MQINLAAAAARLAESRQKAIGRNRPSRKDSLRMHAPTRRAGIGAEVSVCLRGPLRCGLSFLLSHNDECCWRGVRELFCLHQV